MGGGVVKSSVESQLTKFEKNRTIFDGRRKVEVGDLGAFFYFRIWRWSHMQPSP